jgi:putative DNA primase/helicase
MAYPLQHPGAKMQSAVVVHGPQGTGKNLFFEAYAKIYGEYAMVLNQGAIEDKFNADWSSRKLFILADEIVARQEMYHLKNQLKSFITGEWVRVNPKNLAAYRERNHMNLAFLSNEKQPVILENDDRRHCVLWTPEKLPAEYYDSVAEEIRNGGVAALYHYLLQRDLSAFRPWTKPPMTRAKQDLIDLGKDSVETFLEEWQSGDLGLPFCPCSSSRLYAAYQSWCRDVGERYPRSAKQFANHVDKLRGWQRTHKSVYDSFHFVPPARRVRVIIPSDVAMERMAANGWQKDRRRPADQTESEWMTGCVLDFEAAVSGRPNDQEDAAWGE